MTATSSEQMRHARALWNILPLSGRREMRRVVALVPVLLALELLALVQLSRLTLTLDVKPNSALTWALLLLLLRSIASWLWTMKVSRAALRAEGQLARNFLADFMGSDEERRKSFGTARTVRAFDSSVTEAISGAMVGFVMLVHDLGLACTLMLGAVVVAPLTGLTILTVMIVAAIGYLMFVTSRASKLAHNLEEAAVSSIARLYLMAQSAREIHAMGRSENFIASYMESRGAVARRRRRLDEIHTSARYYIEVIMFISIVVFAVVTYWLGASVSIPVALVLGMRVAPAVQRSLADWTRVRASAPALTTLLTAPALGKPASPDAISAMSSGGTCVPVSRPVLQARNVAYRYPSATSDVFCDVSVQVDLGDVLIVTGDIGTGKSTLLDLLLGVRRPTQGEVRLLGVDAHKLNQEMRQRIGLVPQQVPVMNASWRENVLFGAPDQGGDEAIWTCLRRVGLENKAGCLDSPLGDGAVHLSGGERQLLGLARVLLTEPTVLFLDEPTSNLDSDSEDLFLEVLATVSRTVSTVLITHRPAPVALATQRLHLGGQLRVREA